MEEKAAATAQERIAELRAHMEEAGELGEDPEDGGKLGGRMVLEQKMKLVSMPGAEALYAVPSEQDWAHDALGEASCVAGTLYADGDPFPEGAAAVSGYFQADADGRWTRVVDGAVPLGAAWADGLEEFPEVLAELQECMLVPAYRHAAEQAALKTLVGA